MATKVSRRAVELLILIADHSTTEPDGPYWVPNVDRVGEWSDSLKRHINVSGSGDANAIKGLWTKGLAKSVKSGPNYSSRITEDGRLYVESLRESGALESV